MNREERIEQCELSLAQSHSQAPIADLDDRLQSLLQRQHRFESLLAKWNSSLLGRVDDLLARALQIADVLDATSDGIAEDCRRVVDKLCDDMSAQLQDCLATMVEEASSPVLRVAKDGIAKLIERASSRIEQTLQPRVEALLGDIGEELERSLQAVVEEVKEQAVQIVQSLEEGSEESALQREIGQRVVHAIEQMVEPIKDAIDRIRQLAGIVGINI